MDHFATTTPPTDSRCHSPSRLRPRGAGTALAPLLVDIRRAGRPPSGQHHQGVAHRPRDHRRPDHRPPSRIAPLQRLVAARHPRRRAAQPPRLRPRALPCRRIRRLASATPPRVRASRQFARFVFLSIAGTAKGLMQMPKQGLRRRGRDDEVREAGPTRGLGLPRHGARIGHQCARGRGHRLLRGAAGLRRLLRGRLDVREPGALRARHDGHPDRQRQQQLLDRFDGAVPCRADDPRRAGRLRDRARLREDAARPAARRRRGPRIPDGQARQGDGRDRRVRIPGGAVDVRRRRPRAHAPIRHHRRAFRQDRLQEPQAFGQQPVRAVPGRVHASTTSWRPR